jgi:outer membrane protein
MIAAAQGEAQAEQTHKGYLQVGVADVAANPHKLQLYVAGGMVPDAGFNSPDETAANVELGWFVNNSWAVSGSYTSEVTTDNIGIGSLAATPQLGSDSFTLMTGTITYHFNSGGMISPYVGGGATFFHSTGATDGVVTGMKIDDAWGGVAQVGVNLDITDRIGLFIDAKQHLINVEARGSMGPYPVDAKLKLDPLVVGAGATFRF